MSNTAHIQVYSNSGQNLQPLPPGTVRTILFIAAIHNVAITHFSNVTNAFSGATRNGWDNNVGLENTNDIINQNGHTSSAALNCKNYNNLSFNDFYLGTPTELSYLFDEINLISSVSVSNGGDAVSNANYWSSREDDNTNNVAWQINQNAALGGIFKSTNGFVRPQKTIELAPTNVYNKGDYAFGGVVFKIFQLTY